MEPRFLLDTDTLIYLRSKRSEKVERRVMALHPGEAAMSVITYGELSFGVAKETQSAAALQRLQSLTAFFFVLALPVTAGQVYGSLYAELESRGQMIGNNDLWIAAHGMAAGLTVVTNNEREFRRIDGLKIENWAS